MSGKYTHPLQTDSDFHGSRPNLKICL